MQTAPISSHLRSPVFHAQLLEVVAGSNPKSYAAMGRSLGFFQASLVLGGARLFVGRWAVAVPFWPHMPPWPPPGLVPGKACMAMNRKAALQGHGGVEGL